MAQQRHPPSPPTRRNPAPAEAASATNPLHFLAGLLFMLVSIAASFMMVLRHFGVMGLPGCGIGSGCDEAARSVWGTVPLVNLPTSSIGLAFFLALALGWLGTRGALTAAFKWIVRLGVMVSAGFLAIIAIEKHLCPYCLAAHAGNVAFWLVVEMAGVSAARRSLPALATISLAFTGSVIVLAAIEFQQKQAILARRERERQTTTQQIIGQTGAATQPAATPSDADVQAVHSPPGGFTGRWRVGPENAPIRVVIFSDYQCEDCRDIEGQMRTILAQHPEISVSAKHFPLCADCNIHMGGKSMHPNACWAARAAETAGILRGNEGFWQMHKWLFDRKGSFTDAELNAGLQQLGYDIGQFTSMMNSSQPLQPVRTDIDEAIALGVMYTPMIFINGVELRGFIKNPTALSRTIEEVAARHPAPGSPLLDKPPLALGKAVEDWKKEHARLLPARAAGRGDWSIGPANAPVQIWVWGDYQIPMTAELEQTVRKAMERCDDPNRFRYIYRHYPANQACNPNITQSPSAAGCWAAYSAEAAGSLGGNEAFWKMHQWLLANPTQMNDEALRGAAPQLGLNADALLAAMASPQVREIVTGDVANGKPMIVQGVPTVYVNGKWVARWKLDPANVLEIILDELAK